MVKTKRRRVLFVVITIAIATAGTFLTLLNNIDLNAWKESLIEGLMSTGIAVALAACFTAMEASFIAAHKEIEETKKLWRKAILFSVGVVLALIMGFAAYQEMKVTLHKLDNKSLTSNFSTLIKGADKSNQRSIGRDAIKAVKQDAIKTEILPFAIGYVAAIISAMIIGAVAEKRQPKTQGRGNLAANNPELIARIQERFPDVDPTTARAYADRNGRGVSVWSRSRQIGYLSNYDVNDQSRD